MQAGQLNLQFSLSSRPEDLHQKLTTLVQVGKLHGIVNAAFNPKSLETINSVTA